MSLTFAISELLYVVASVFLATVLIKGAYDIYIKKDKIELKNKPLVKYGMPFIGVILLMAYLFGS